MENFDDHYDHYICVDCGCKVVIHNSNINANRCKSCEREYRDKVYLDEGSMPVLRERADRDEDVMQYSHDDGLDKLLEEY